ncbi:serine/threonine protein kinase, partial [Streptomyces kunmingensis]|nr:serine/threonine protein kinase [Streptomyces kunmingensis]
DADKLTHDGGAVDFPEPAVYKRPIALNPPAYGYPHQPHPSAYGYPQGAWGGTPPYGPGAAPLVAPQQEPPRRGRSTAALVAVALIVALGAGGSVYALMKDDGDPSTTAQDDQQSPSPTAPVQPGPDSPAPTPTPTPAPSTEPERTPQSAAGEIPTKFLGTWTSGIDNERGHHPRRIVLQQGETGDTVLSMTADGTQKDGKPYHCVFQGTLTSATDSTLRIGNTDPVVAEPPPACTPGKPSTITFLSSGQLRRVMIDSAGKRQVLTYDKSD